MQTARRICGLPVSGFGSVNLGTTIDPWPWSRACRAALDEQASGFTPSAINPLAAALAEQLVALAPPGLEMVFFANSGTAESVEAGLKLAWAATCRPRLALLRAFLPRQITPALSVTGNGVYQRPFGPLLPECQTIPFGDVAALERALHTQAFRSLYR